MAGPLKGLKIVELAGIGPAPFAAMLLSDMGAEILRIEAPFAREPSVSQERETDVTLRGRRSLTLDLKTAAHREYLLQICARADMLIEGFRPGVMERLELGPEQVAAVNPRLVYGRMTGWGQTGPLSRRAGHDINYIAIGGALAHIGPAVEVPPPPLNLIGDNGGGALYLAMGLLAAYIEAQQSGAGQVVDAAIADGTASLMAPFFGMWAAGKWSLERECNLIDGYAPWYRCYSTSDGKYIAVGAIETKFFNTLTELLGLRADDLPDQFDRERWPEMTEKIAARFAQKTRDEWADILEGSDTCAVPVLSMDEMADHPHIAARETITTHQGILQPAPAPRFSRTPGTLPNLTIGEVWDPTPLLETWGVTQPPPQQ